LKAAPGRDALLDQQRRSTRQESNRETRCPGTVAGDRTRTGKPAAGVQAAGDVEQQAYDSGIYPDEIEVESPLK
jgi:hypothetical protein